MYKVFTVAGWRRAEPKTYAWMLGHADGLSRRRANNVKLKGKEKEGEEGMTARPCAERVAVAVNRRK